LIKLHVGAAKICREAFNVFLALRQVVREVVDIDVEANGIDYTKRWSFQNIDLVGSRLACGVFISLRR
jgi:hypothetical protein